MSKRKIYIEVHCKDKDHCSLDCPFLWIDGDDQDTITNADCEGPWRNDWEKSGEPVLPLEIERDEKTGATLIKRHPECVHRERAINRLVSKTRKKNTSPDKSVDNPSMDIF